MTTHYSYEYLKFLALAALMDNTSKHLCRGKGQGGGICDVAGDEVDAGVVVCGRVPVRPSVQERAIPMREDITIPWLADSFRALIGKSMSICASSSPGRLPARLKSPNEA